MRRTSSFCSARSTALLRETQPARRRKCQRPTPVEATNSVARDAAAARVPEVQDPELRPPRLLLVPREPRGGYASLPNYKFVKGDICSADLVNYVLETEKIDTIMHFAAQTHVDNSFGNSFQFVISNNILAQHVLLPTAKVHDVVRFVHVSTDEVYGEGESMETAPMIEDHVLEPRTRICGDQGGGRVPREVLPPSLRAARDHHARQQRLRPAPVPREADPQVHEPARARRAAAAGTGENTRNFLFVEDVARAFDCILHKAEIGKVYNIGKGSSGSRTSRWPSSSSRSWASRTRRRPSSPSCRTAPSTTRYTIDNSALEALGWKGSWPGGGLAHRGTSKTCSVRYANIEQALVARLSGRRIRSKMSAIWSAAVFSTSSASPRAAVVARPAGMARTTAPRAGASAARQQN